MTPLRRFHRLRSRPLTTYPGDDGTLRHATWLELFLDLVFVLAVAELGGSLETNLTTSGLLQFAGLFAVVWWIWLSISYFADTYDTDDLTSQLLVILAMFGVIFLSQTIDGTLAGDTVPFAASVLVLRLFLTASHLRAWHLRPTARDFLTTWLGLEVVVTVVWALSLVVDGPARVWLWGTALAIGVVGMAAIYLRYETILAPGVSHCNERFGLFTIIVLGETLLAVGLGIGGIDFAPAELVVGGLGFLVAVAVWWLYFAGYQERVFERMMFARTANWRSLRRRGIAHVYGHFFVHAGIVAAGVGIASVIEATVGGHTIDDGARVALGIGLGMFLLGSGISTAATRSAGIGRFVATRVGAIALLLLLAAVGGAIDATSLLGLVVLVLVVLAIVEGVSPWTTPDPVPLEG